MAEGALASEAQPGEQRGASGEPTTKRLEVKKQSLDDAYAAPANLLEIEVAEPENHGFGRQRYTDYEIRMRVRSPASPQYYRTEHEACERTVSARAEQCVKIPCEHTHFLC